MIRKLAIAIVLSVILSVPCAAYSAQAYALMDADTGRVLAQGNGSERLPMASTTKIMTALVAIESGDLNRMIKVPASCAGVEGSSMYLQAGEMLPLRDVLYGLMLCSGNDAAMCIAEVCGGLDSFVARMNERAEELGLTDTHFDNPSGLDGETHYTTALELAKIASEGLKNETFRTIVSTKSYTTGTRTMVNHNKMLSRYEGAVGVKTGFTKQSGRCLVSAAERNGRTLVAVTLNDPNDWEDHTAMLDFGFADMEETLLYAQGATVREVPVMTGMDDSVAVQTTQPVSAWLFADEQPEVVVKGPKFVYAPVRAGDSYGTLEWKSGDAVLASCPLVYAEDVSLDVSQEKQGVIERILSYFNDHSEGRK
ncbi:MAG: D-alanyl-D-alanine carboxypeptidase family protein [Butyricicoccaceae bacterium]